MRLLSALLALSFSSEIHAADRAGEFDYFILALSWKPGWCLVEGDAKGDESCDIPSGFTLHGLWPQYEEGWPEFCSTAKPNPSRSETRRQTALYGSSGLAWHQWNKHGRCTGLSHQDYYSLSAELYENFQKPEIFSQIDTPLKLTPEVIEDAVIEANPEMSGATMSVICKAGTFVELRICLDKELAPTECLGNAARDCDYSPHFEPIE